MIRRAAITLSLMLLVGCGHTKDIHPVAAWNANLESELSHSFENKEFVLGHTFNIGPRLNDFSANLADPRPFDAFAVTDADGFSIRQLPAGKCHQSAHRSRSSASFPQRHPSGPGRSARKTTQPTVKSACYLKSAMVSKGTFHCCSRPRHNQASSCAAMNQRFQSETWLNSWFATRTNEVKEAIKAKKG